MVNSTITSLFKKLQYASLHVAMLVSCVLCTQQVMAQCALAPTVGPYSVTINLGPGGTALLDQAAVSAVLTPVNGTTAPCMAGCSLFFRTTSGGVNNPSINLSCDGTTPDGGGTYYVVARNGAGCESNEVVLNVTLNDVSAPSLAGGDCGGTVTANTSDDAAGNCSTSVDIDIPTITENCLANATVTIAYTDGTPAPAARPADETITGAAAITTLSASTISRVFSSANNNSPGQTIVTITVNDGVNTAASCSFMVEVTDDEDPLATCPADQLATTNMDLCSYTHSGTGWDATFTDNCGLNDTTYSAPGATLASTKTLNGAVFPFGTTTVTVTITDYAGRTDMCDFDVTISDDDAPSIMAHGPQTANTSDDGTGDCSVNWNAAGLTSIALTINPADMASSLPLMAGQAYDNCGVTSTTYELTGATSTGGTVSGTDAGTQSFNAGVTTVEYCVDDAAGNGPTCTTFTVTVTDDEMPDMPVCPADASISTLSGTCATLYTWTAPTALTDNCNISTFTCEAEDKDGNAIATFSTDPAGCSSVTGFLGDYLPGNWTQNLNGGDNISHSSSTLAITGSSNTSSFPFFPTSNHTHSTITATDDGLLLFDYNSDNGGAGADASFVSINGANTFLGNGFGTQTGTSLFSIQAGDVIRFFVTSNGNTGVQTLTISNFSFFCSGSSTTANFPLGKNTVTYTVTDAGGNSSTCSFEVEVKDTEVPTASCQNATIQLDASGNAAVTPAQINNGSNDNCPGALSFSLSQTAFGCKSLGNNTVTFTATDAGGNSATCTAIVTVEDNIAPSITCPSAGLTKNTDKGVCTFTMGSTGFDATATDNCAVSTLTHNFTSTTSMSTTTLDGHTFPTGTTIVTWTASDASGNTSTCQVPVTVEDNEGPSIDAIADISVNSSANGTGDCSTTAGWTVTAMDNCSPSGSISIISSPPSGSLFTVGTNPVTVTATDQAGNPSMITFNVIVTDNEDPVISCPPNQTVNTICPTNTVPDFTGFAATSDNCGLSTVTQSPNTMTTLAAAVGSTPVDGSSFVVTLTATDNAGRTSTCTFTVTLDDSANPVPNQGVAGGQLPLESDVACGGSFNLAAPTATDNVCSGAMGNTIHATLTPWPLAGVSAGTGNTYDFVAGSYFVTWVYNDGNGNSTAQSQQINIGADNQAPMCVAQNLSRNLDGSGSVTVMASEVDNGSTDNCGIASVEIALDDGNDNFGSSLTFSCSDAGNNVAVLLRITDTYGPSPNVSTCSASISINDVTAPSFSCVGNRSVDTDSGDCTYEVTTTGWDPTSAMDNCGVQSVTHDYSSAPSSSTLEDAVFPEGTTTVTWTVTDVNSLTATCSFTVTVSDNENPTLDCPADATVGIADDGTPNDCTYTASGGEFDYSNDDDNCGVLSVTHDYGAAPMNTSLDGADFSIGTTTVIWTITDVHSNTNTCAVDITVEDDVAPTAACTNGFTVSYTNSLITITPAQVNAGSSDGCGTISSVTLWRDLAGTIAPDFDCDDADNTTQHPLYLIVEDDAGNKAVCQTYVIIQDLVAPAPVCNPITVQLNASGGYSLTQANIDAIAAGSSDNCSLAASPYSVSPSSFSCSDVGANVVTLTVTDIVGNTATCTTTVTVEDLTGPSCGTADITVQLNAAGMHTLTSMEETTIAGTSGDPCNISSISVSPNTFTCGDIGASGVAVVVTVTDGNGNSTTCSANVTVEDNVDPVADCQNLTMNLGTGGDIMIPASAFNSASSDACGGLTYEYGDGSTMKTFDCMNLGTAQMTIIVKDGSGNSATCTPDLTLLPNATVEFIGGNGMGASGTTIDIPITVENFWEMRSFQFTVSVADPSVATLDDIIFNINGTTAIGGTGNARTVSWNAPAPPDGLELMDGDTAFYARVTLVGAGGTTSDLVLDGSTITVLASQGCAPIEILENITLNDGDVTVVTGTSSLVSGTISREGDGVNNVTVDLTGMDGTGANISESTTTNASGYYEFNVPVGSSVTITPSKNTGVTNGVESVDASIIRSHTASGTPVITSPYRLIAGDVNLSNGLGAADPNSIDAGIIQNLVAGNFVDFSIWMNTSWRFVAGAHTFTDPENPWLDPIPDVINLGPLTADAPNQDFEAIKNGDVGALRANPALATAQPTVEDRTDNTLYLQLEDQAISSGQSYRLDFRARDFEDLMAYQLTLDFDPHLLGYAKMEAGQLNNIVIGDQKAKDGQIAIVWAEAFPMDLDEEAILFSLVFEGINDGSKLSDILSLSNDITSIKAFDSQYKSLDIELEFNTLTSNPQLDADQFELFQNQPNPFRAQTVVGFKLPKASVATFSIFDITGRKVFEQKGSFLKGYNELTINDSDLNSIGVLYYQLETSEKTAIRKMTILK